MTVMRAATEEWLLANPPDTGALSTLALPASDPENPFKDTLVYMELSGGYIFAIYVDDGSEVTGRNFAHDELDQFIADGGVIEGYNP